MARPRSSRSTGEARIAVLLLGLGAAWVCSACTPGFRPPLKPIYSHADLDKRFARVLLDVPYRDDDEADPAKHRLDLYLPAGEGWPMLVFVHGGSLEKGDSAQRLVGHDIYRNIGRFYASRGVGVALVNYRLQPEVNWVGQAEDVATAVAWLAGRLEQIGGDGRFYLSGHSAGAWLVGRVALDDDLQSTHGIEAESIDGVISVSGSGFDLTDEITWEMFGREKRWRRRFSAEPDEPNWKEHASLMPLLTDESPPFFLFYSAKEWPALVRQNKMMCEALEETAVGCRITEIKGLGHRRMLLAMSHAGKPLAPKILEAMGVPAVEGGDEPDPTTGDR